MCGMYIMSIVHSTTYFLLKNCCKVHRSCLMRPLETFTFLVHVPKCVKPHLNLFFEIKYQCKWDTCYRIMSRCVQRALPRTILIGRKISSQPIRDKDLPSNNRRRRKGKICGDFGFLDGGFELYQQSILFTLMKNSRSPNR